MPHLRLLTINCMGWPVPMPGTRHRLLALGKAIHAADADLVCLQEVGRWRYLPWLRGATDTWPYALARTHPYAPRGGLVTLCRLPVTQTSYHTFVARGPVTSLHTTEWYQSKGTLRTDVAAAGVPLAIFNTHLAANYNARWSRTNPYAKIERAQLRELAAWINDMHPETLVIVAGDYNVPRGSWLYEEFRIAARLIDPCAASSEPTYRPLPGVPDRAVQALDHVLVRVPLTMRLSMQAELCFRDTVVLAHGRRSYLSDHLGVQVDLHWEAAEHMPPDEAVP